MQGIFAVSGTDMTIDKSVANQGSYTFYVIASSRSDDKEKIQVNVLLKPCATGVATVTAPSSFTNSPFFTEVGNDGAVQFNLALDTLNPADITAQKAVVEVTEF